MKLLIVILAALPAFAQNYTSYNNQPVARMSFLRSQWQRGQNALRDSSLIGYWPLLQKTDQAYDLSGNGLSGAFKGNAPGFLGGKIGPWAPYDNKSNGNYVGISSITIPVPFTVSAWVKANALTGNYDRIAETLFSSGFYLGTDTSLLYYQLLVNTTVLTGCIGGTVTPGAWQLVTATYDGVNGYLYVNGAQMAGPCAYTSPGTKTLSMRIGCFNSGASCSSASGAWDGYISDFRIYGRALSAGEILAIYNAENH